MTRTTLSRTIKAPIERVFETVSSIDKFAQAIPHITRVDILSDIKAGAGKRFRETRLMNGKEMTTALEVTEHVDNERVRIVSYTHGTVWDTVFTVSPRARKPC